MGLSDFLWPRKKKKQKDLAKEQENLVDKQETRNKKVLVISGGWFRWTYALWVMKAMEECNIYEEIDAIYWVSIWAIVWSLRSYWMKADDIFDVMLHISIKDFYGSDILKKSWGFVSNKKIKSLLDKYLPANFESLKIPFYAGAVDTNTAEFKLFRDGDLRKIVLWSMSIPWIFSPVSYLKYSLVDGWVLNNFPVDLAKQDYPNHDIIWIALNKFQINQRIKSAFDNLLVNFDVMMRSKSLENIKLVNYLFYRDLPIHVLSLNKKQMQEAFVLWYKDWLKLFKQ